jgi:phosphoserine aminotransferase
MLVLSPRAVARLESYAAPRALPKIFRMTGKGKLTEGIFVGETINTPSMLAVEDCLDALKWVDGLGGWRGTEKRAAENLKVIFDWVSGSDWIEFLPNNPAIYSRTSICLKVKESVLEGKNDEEREAFVKALTKRLEKEEVAYDINSYKTAPAGIRIWAGATVEAEDLRRLTAWLDWSYKAA